MKANIMIHYKRVVLLFLIQQMTGSFSLRDLLLSIPPAVNLGDTVLLNCTYHLQGEKLYTIKIYKGRHEIIQYVPEKSDKVKIFPRKGIHIQNITLSGSGNTATGLHVIFRDVTLFTTGLYGCEASADPSFHTQLTRKHLTVLVKPESRPVIVGEYKGGTGPRSRAGDTLKMKCYVNSTFPSANVTWFVNGKMVTKDRAKQRVLTEPTKLLTTRSELELPVTAQDFVPSQDPDVKVIRIKCLASILTMHWQSRDVLVREESPTLASVVGDKSNSTTDDVQTEEPATAVSDSGGGHSIKSPAPTLTPFICKWLIVAFMLIELTIA